MSHDMDGIGLSSDDQLELASAERKFRFHRWFAALPGLLPGILFIPFAIELFFNKNHLALAFVFFVLGFAALTPFLGIPMRIPVLFQLGIAGATAVTILAGLSGVISGIAGLYSLLERPDADVLWGLLGLLPLPCLYSISETYTAYQTIRRLEKRRSQCLDANHDMEAPAGWDEGK